MSETHIIPSTDLYAAHLPSDPETLFGFLSEAVSDALKPANAYEAYLVGQITELDIEILRHRQMSNALIQNELGNEVIVALTGHRLLGSRTPDGLDLRAIHDPKRAEAKSIANDLNSSDPTRVTQAKAQLTEHGVDLALLTARAYQAATGIAAHNDAIERLEVRRRRLHQDFDRMVNARAQAATPVSQ
ncbi:hypothetical protein [Marivivens donghaensis]|uniref:hypothetical protein n=1 Tax=Marivivens donghaensis TaxID=1699413 RepID=UPI00201FA144|nr:hypothetical protein [Marivivens donghaensis]MCL7410155.1 hypothetical protein [Marivivens donghaensis]MDN3703381.1 hypothetical protein [Marivivens donghaensis]